MKKLALVLVLGLSAIACSKPHKVEAPAPAPPPAEPAPEPAPPPKVADTLTLPDQIEFETNEARIKQTPKTMASLEQLASQLKKHPEITKLRIEGHTDNVGKERLNEKLSKARAQAVATWLSQHEIEASRLVAVGYGAKRPLVSNDSPEHRQMNRRTEYVVEERDGKKVDGKESEKVASGTTAGGKTAN